MSEVSPTSATRAETPGSDTVYAISYVSRPTRSVTDGDLASLLFSARRFNNAHGITGRLVVLDKGGQVVRFLQWFEGHAEPVVQCLERIVADGLHHDIRIVQQGRVDGRRYSQWDMAFESVGPEAFDRERDSTLNALVMPGGGIVELAVQGLPTWTP